jgi:hypothetical protein
VSIYRLVLEAVLRLGRCSISQAVAEVAWAIPPVQAAAHGRRERRYNAKQVTGAGVARRKMSLTELGKRVMVKDYLVKLCKRGEVRRVGRGVYAPPEPRLYKVG